MSGASVEEFRQRARATWEAGDYAALARYVEGVGRRVVASAAVTPGTAALDVACGTGNAAIPAALAGARVTALDLAPTLLEGGRAKAADAGVEIEWVEGDAEELPFADDSFDYVFSTFGHMFAPRHRRVADEMLRVCRGGGTLGICCWTPEGTFGRLSRAGAPFLPPPPDFASPPTLWGTRAHVREMLGAAASDLAFEEHSATIEWESTEGFAEYFMANFPVMVTARRMLGDRFVDFRRAVVDVWNDVNQATDGTLRLPQEYLQSVIRLA